MMDFVRFMMLRGPVLFPLVVLCAVWNLYAMTCIKFHPLSLLSFLINVGYIAGNYYWNYIQPNTVRIKL